jgi:superfamily I DNA and/or RNA helicase
MPDLIASFISSHFYDGRLDSDRRAAPSDPVFSSPLAFVSTSDQPADRRREKQRRGSVNGRGASYYNDLEAELIVRLVAERQSLWPEHAVIVPYRGQQLRIADALAARLGETRSGDVGTVDAFQGGERDLIIFSFTRSNKRGAVGFLKELRRLNVAMTRAKSQLILVGDLDFLSQATDAPFRDFIQALTAYLRSHGDLRTSAEFLDPQGR